MTFQEEWSPWSKTNGRTDKQTQATEAMTPARATDAVPTMQVFNTHNHKMSLNEEMQCLRYTHTCRHIVTYTHSYRQTHSYIHTHSADRHIATYTHTQQTPHIQPENKLLSINVTLTALASPMTLSFNPLRAMVMTYSHEKVQSQR